MVCLVRLLFSISACFDGLKNLFLSSNHFEQQFGDKLWQILLSLLLVATIGVNEHSSASSAGQHSLPAANSKGFNS
jgi:hypothetical protein